MVSTSHPGPGTNYCPFQFLSPQLSRPYFLKQKSGHIWFWPGTWSPNMADGLKSRRFWKFKDTELLPQGSSESGMQASPSQDARTRATACDSPVHLGKMEGGCGHLEIMEPIDFFCLRAEIGQSEISRKTGVSGPYSGV